MSQHFVTIGSGAWATTVAHILAENGFQSSLLVHSSKYEECINTRHENIYKLPTIPLSHQLHATQDSVVLSAATHLVLALPTVHFQTFNGLPLHLMARKPLLNLSKGLIQADSPIYISDFVTTLITDCKFATLSGPNLASEIIDKQPAASVIASHDPEVSAVFQHALATDYFRIYTSQDVRGVEFGGIVKNVYAIAAGCMDSMNLGFNAKASFLCRVLEEMKRIAHYFSISNSSLTGLSGLGDLIATCSSSHSRNYKVGFNLGTPNSFEISGYAEGPKTAVLLNELTTKHSIDAPILSCITQIIKGDLSLQEGLKALMTRELKAEFGEQESI